MHERSQLAMSCLIQGLHAPQPPGIIDETTNIHPPYNCSTVLPNKHCSLKLIVDSNFANSNNLAFPPFFVAVFFLTNRCVSCISITLIELILCTSITRHYQSVHKMNDYLMPVKYFPEFPSTPRAAEGP